LAHPHARCAPRLARRVAQFISMCRWLQLIYKNWRAPLSNAVCSTPWARKRYSVAQLFHLTDCESSAAQAFCVVATEEGSSSIQEWDGQKNAEDSGAELGTTCR